MRRDYWTYPESNLFVEKYSNVVNKEHFDSLDGSLIAKMDKTREINAIIDMSDATLFNIHYGEISDLFSGFISRLGDSNVSAKIAIFCGGNSKDDFLKISTFTKYETTLVKIECYAEWLPLFNWLELENKLRDNILGVLIP